MMKTSYLFLIIISFLRCTNGAKFESTSNDTIEVVKKIIDDKHLKNVFIKKSDTIFILKSKNINPCWAFSNKLV